MEAIARAVARSYARRCWWADVRDLEGEAYIAILDALPHFDPAVGVPRSAYLRRAAVNACGRSLWRMSSPVSHAGTTRGVHRADLDEAIPVDAPDPEEHSIRARWLSAVADRLFALAMKDTDVKLGLAVVLSESTAREYAQDWGLPEEAVKRAARKARRAVSRDRRLWELWADAPT